MSRPPARPSQLRRRPFLASAAISAGLLTRAQVRSLPWRHLFRDVYVSASVQVTHKLMVEAAALILPPAAVITGRSAAVLWGAPMGDIDDPVEVLTARRFGPVSGLAIRSGNLPPEDVDKR